MKKSEAIALRDRLRSEGKTVKLFKREGISTQPGKGIVPYVDYFVKEIK